MPGLAAALLREGREELRHDVVEFLVQEGPLVDDLGDVPGLELPGQLGGTELDATPLQGDLVFPLAAPQRELQLPQDLPPRERRPRLRRRGRILARQHGGHFFFAGGAERDAVVDPVGDVSPLVAHLQFALALLAPVPQPEVELGRHVGRCAPDFVFHQAPSPRRSLAPVERRVSASPGVAPR